MKVDIVHDEEEVPFNKSIRKGKKVVKLLEDPKKRRVCQLLIKRLLMESSEPLNGSEISLINQEVVGL